MITLEQMLCSPRFFGLPATPVQRAIARAADGNPLDDLAQNPDVIAAFGGERAMELLPVGVLPSRVDVYSGIRTAKSLFAAAAAICMSQRGGVSKLRVGETPRIPLLSLDLDKARVVLDHLTGALTTKPALKALLADDIKGDSIFVWHPTGKKIEIMTAAGKRAGGSLVARWLLGVVFDEAPRMLGADEGVVNLEDALAAAEGRILPGGQIWCIGSPYAPWGPSFDSVQKHWGAPSRHRVVVKAPAPVLNPVWWTPQRCADLKETNPRAYQCDVLAEFADASTSAFQSEWIDRAMRDAGEVEALDAPIGIIDSAAGRGDSWTYCVAQMVVPAREREVEGELMANGMLRVKLDANNQFIRKAPAPRTPMVLVFGWGAYDGRFGETISFDDVVKQMCAHFETYGVQHVYGDQFQQYALSSAIPRHGKTYWSNAWSAENKVEGLARARNWFRDGTIIIEGGEQSASIRRELVQLQEKPTASGGVTIGARRAGHDDRAACIINLGLLESLGALRGSPIQKNYRLYSGNVVDTMSLSNLGK